MKICLFVHNMPNKGSWFRALEIAKRLVAYGHNVTLFCTSATKYYRHRVTHTPEGPDIVECGNWTLFNDRQEGWGLFDIFERLWLILKIRPQFVYAFSHKPCCLFPALLAKLFGAKLALDWSDWWGGPEGLYHSSVLTSYSFNSLPHTTRLLRRCVFALDSALESYCLGCADRITLTSKEFYSHPRFSPERKERSLVMYSGADLHLIYPMNKTEVRAALTANGCPIPQDARILCYMGNFNPDEQMLLTAFAKVCECYDDVWLLVVGAGFENTPPEVNNAISHRVYHAGHKPFKELRTYLGAADLLLLPQDDRKLNRARYPNKLSDYVAAGRPVVGCNVGIAGELIAEHQLGYLSQPNAEDFAKNMIAALDAGQVAWAEVGQHNRKKAEEFWNWDGICATLFRFLGIEPATGTQPQEPACKP